MVFVGWVERSETQHPRWVALRLTQPTNQSLNLAKLMWRSTSHIKSTISNKPNLKKCSTNNSTDFNRRSSRIHPVSG
jgi:hypothetical protein